MPIMMYVPMCRCHRMNQIDADGLSGFFPGKFIYLTSILFDFDALGFVSPLGKVHIRRIFAVGNAR